MSKIKLDLKDFQHVESDKHFTTLKHAKGGHVLKIAHSALSKDMRSQLEALCHPESKPEPKHSEKPEEKQQLAEGGQVKDETKEEIEPEPQETPAGTPTPQMFAEGSVVQDPMEQVKQEYNNETVNSFVDPLSTISRLGNMMSGEDMPTVTDQSFGPNQEPQDFDPQRWNKAKISVANQNLEQAKAKEEALIKATQANSARVEAGLPPLPTGAVDVSQPAESSQVPDVSQMQPERQPSLSDAVPAKPDPYDPSKLLEKGYQNTIAAEQKQAKAISEAALAQEKIHTDQAAAIQEGKQAYQRTFDELNAERQGLMEDLKNTTVSPENYWKDHSKVMTGIGMILAGFNPTTKPNAAVEFLQFQMNKNLEAQAAELGKKNNLLSANLHQFKNMNDAVEMTRIMQADYVTSLISAQAAKSSSPLAQAAAQKAIGNIQFEASKRFEELAKRQTLKTLTSSIQGAKNPQELQRSISALAAIDPKAAQDYMDRMIPGVGLASTPKDAEYLKEVETRRSNIRNNAEKALALIKEHGTYEAFGSHNAELDNLAEQIATDQAKMIDPASAARPAEVEAVKRTLFKPELTMQNKTAKDQLKKFYDTVDARATQAYRTRGVSAPQAQGLSPQTSPNAAKEWLTANPNHPKAEQVRKALEQLGSR